MTTEPARSLPGQEHTILRRQIVQELARSGKWHQMPELLNRMHEARVALQAGPCATAGRGAAAARPAPALAVC